MKKKIEKWFKLARKLYRKGRLQAPYEMLFRYYLEIDESLSIRGPHGHFDHFSMLKFDGVFEKSVRDMRAILPQRLLENYLTALDAYQNLGEDPNPDDIFDTLYQYDEFAAEHAEEIATLLCDYVTELATRHAF